jgi:hypothetical protein
VPRRDGSSAARNGRDRRTDCHPCRCRHRDRCPGRRAGIRTRGRPGCRPNAHRRGDIHRCLSHGARHDRRDGCRSGRCRRGCHRRPGRHGRGSRRFVRCRRCDNRPNSGRRGCRGSHRNARCRCPGSHPGSGHRGCRGTRLQPGHRYLQRRSSGCRRRSHRARGTHRPDAVRHGPGSRGSCGRRCRGSRRSCDRHCRGSRYRSDGPGRPALHHLVTGSRRCRAGLRTLRCCRAGPAKVDAPHRLSRGRPGCGRSTRRRAGSARPIGHRRSGSTGRIRWGARRRSGCRGPATAARRPCFRGSHRFRFLGRRHGSRRGATDGSRHDRRRRPGRTGRCPAAGTPRGGRHRIAGRTHPDGRRGVASCCRGTGRGRWRIAHRRHAGGRRPIRNLGCRRLGLSSASGRHRGRLHAGGHRRNDPHNSRHQDTKIRPPPHGGGLIILFDVGGVLLSHTLTSAVPSALEGLASGFGKGPGVPPPPKPPTTL